MAENIINKVKIGSSEYELEAVKLDSSAGSVTQPVYFSDGKPVATTYTLGANVPSCSTSNNGQFLRVVNGVATWSSVPNAEEASF